MCSSDLLTTYRRMAADTIDEVMDRLDRKGGSHTKRLPLIGTDGWDRTGCGEHLEHRFGSEATHVRALADTDPALAAPLVPGLPYLAAEAVHAVRHEMARSLDDVLTRRTRARLFARDATADAAESVAALIAGDLGWSPERARQEAAAFRADVEHERTSGALPHTALDALAGA